MRQVLASLGQTLDARRASKKNPVKVLTKCQIGSCLGLAVESWVTTKGKGGEMLSRSGGGSGTAPQPDWWLRDNAHLSELSNCKKVRKETVEDEFIVRNFFKGIPVF